MKDLIKLHMKKGEKMKKSKNIILNIICGFITTLSIFSLNEIIVNSPGFAEIASEKDSFLLFLIKLRYNFKNAYGVIPFFVFIAMSYFFYVIPKDRLSKKMKWTTRVVGAVVSLTVVLGQSLLEVQGISLLNYDIFQAFAGIVKIIGYYYLAYNVLTLMICTLNEHSDKIISDAQSIERKFDKHPVLFTSLIFFILYLPYVIFYYPGGMNLDTLFQINQFFGASGWNSHHPIISTIVYGLFMKFAMIFNNSNLGIFLPNIVQLAISIVLISSIIDYIYKYTHNRVIRICLIAIFGLVPVWPINFYSAQKDIPFILAMLGIIFIYMKNYLSKEEISRKDLLLYFLAAVVLLSFRHNGLHTLLFTIVFMLLFMKDKNIKKLIGITCVAIVCVTLINSILTKTLKISKGSKAEMLSIPLQQTATYVMNYRNELTDDEIKAIEKIVNVDAINEKTYDPLTVDYVKANCKSFTNEDLKGYFITWFKMFFKHPKCYIMATLNSTFGYVDPDFKETKDEIAPYPFGYAESVDKMQFKMHRYDELAYSRSAMEKYAFATRNTPIGIIYSCGLYFWVVALGTIIILFYGKIKDILPLVPLYAVEIIAFMSPVNAYVRYVLPIMISAPFLIVYVMIVVHNGNLSGKNTNIKNEENIKEC